jgi:hypothetical protein
MLLQKLRHGQRLFLDLHVLVQRHHLFRVEGQVFRVVSQEADDVGFARNGGKIFLFQGPEVLFRDMGVPGDLFQGVMVGFPRFFQFLSQ